VVEQLVGFAFGHPVPDGLRAGRVSDLCPATVFVGPGLALPCPARLGPSAPARPAQPGPAGLARPGPARPAQPGSQQDARKKQNILYGNQFVNYVVIIRNTNDQHYPVIIAFAVYRR